MSSIETILEMQFDTTKELIKKNFSNFLILLQKTGENWYLHPAIQLEMFNTTIIKIKSFNPPQTVTRNIPKRKLKILYHLLDKKENLNSHNLKTDIDFLFENQFVKIYCKDEYQQREIKFVNIKSINLQFKPYDYINDEIIFKPIIKINPILGNPVILDHSNDLFLSGNLYILNQQAGFIYYLKIIKEIQAGLEFILKPGDFLSQKNIEAVQKKIVNNKTEILQLDFPSKACEIINLEPIPILEINELSQGITIKLFFKYEENLYQYNREEKIIILKETIDRFTILTFKKQIHDDIYIFIKQLLGQLLVREKPVPRGTDYTFSAACNFESFIFTCGEAILAKGIEIRKTGQKQKIKKAKGLSFRVNYKIDWLDVKAGITDEYGVFKEITYNPETLQKMLLKSKDTFYLITKKELEKLKQLWLLGMTEKGALKLSKYNSFFINTFYEDILNKEAEEFSELKSLGEKLLHFTQIDAVKVPDNFCGELRAYQHAGLDWLYFLYKYNLNGCLADDMGLGKTVQTLALLQKIKEENTLSIALIVTPVSTLANWENEIHRFTPQLKTYKYHGANRNKDLNEIEKNDIILVSYATLRNDLEFFLKIPICYLILDEAQAIKNPSSLITKSIKLLQPKHKLSLSGTPIENNTLELWSQFDFLLPGLLGSEKDFCIRFSKPIEEKGKKEETELLKKIIFPFILRRKKEDVATDLPDKEEIVVYVEMEDEQRKIYNEVKHQIKNELLTSIDELGVKKSTMEIFTALLRLRQITLFPAMIKKEYAHIPSCKFEFLKTLIEEIIEEDHKVLIFSQFIKSLKIIQNYFNKLNLQYSYLDGSTKAREKEIQQFQENEKIKIFLISLKAGGKGINLTEADYVILFDPWWNPAIEKQAIDRAHRIGQKKKVIAYKIITKDTVEEKILALQEKKLHLVNNLIIEEKSFFKSLTKDDIISLFA